MIREIYPCKTVEFKMPRFFLAKDKSIFANNSRYKIKASYLRLYKNVWITYDGIAYKYFKAIKHLIVCYNTDFKFYKNKFLLKALLYLKRRFIGTNNNEKYLLIFDNYSGPFGFAHWLCDGLTRLVEMRDEINNYTIVAPHYFEKEQIYYQSLAAFNIKKTLVINEHEAVRFSKLYICDHLADTGIFIPENIKKVRNFYWDYVNEKKVSIKPMNKIYISRKAASRRFVENEREVEALLGNEGFSIVQMEKYSFYEQIAIVKAADVVMGIHGAALSLAMFMRTDSSLIELRRENDSINNIFYNLSSAADLNYYYLSCKSTLVAENANSFNLSVDINELKILLSKMTT